MARTVQDAKLSSRSARSELAVRGKPFWKAIDEGLHIGYRRNQTGGKWVARYYSGDGAYATEVVATADDILDADGVAILNFSQAQALIRKRHVERARLAKGLPVDNGPYRVRNAIDDYITYLAGQKKTAQDARCRADALIIPMLGDVPVEKLTADRLQRWLEDVANAPPRVRSKKGGKQRYREFDSDDEEQRRKRRSTANRTLTTLRAALNRAWRGKKVSSDSEWRRLEPFKEVDAASLRYLEVAEAQRLINAAADDGFRELVQAALLTGCRYGELGRLRVGDFKGDSGSLHIRTSKAGKSRHVVLNDEGLAFFGSITAGRPAAESMLRSAGGGTWTKGMQTIRMVEACKHAGITPPIGFHALRHTYASLAVMAGAPLLVLARNLGHSDTRMVEKHYGHLSRDYVAEQIRLAAPRFGVAEAGNVVPIAAGRNG